MRNIRVLIVDDSLFMRTVISRILSSAGGIEIVGLAKNGQEGVQKAIELKPDIITMDIEMPIMTGIQALKEIMRVAPTRVIMVSTLTEEGADSTIEALALGAIDYVTKKTSDEDIDSMKQIIIDKVKQFEFEDEVAKKPSNFTFTQRTSSQTDTKSSSPKVFKRNKSLLGKERPKPSDIKLIMIGISTGGPQSLIKLFEKMPVLPVPICIVQHMPPHFTNSFAKRLDTLTKATVKEAEDNERLLPGYVYIAPGGRQMNINKLQRLIINDKKPDNDVYAPSVNVFFNTAIDVFKNQIVGLIMTGMGYDGTTSLTRLSQLGGYVLSQDIESSIISGMPKSLQNAGVVDEIHSLEELPKVLASFFNL